MAWLFIDSHDRGTIRYGWLDAKRIRVCTVFARAGDILLNIAKERRLLKEAEGICVVAGPGSFSSVRTGVLHANLLSRLLKRPLVGVLAEEAQDLSILVKRLDSRKIKTSSYVAPLYDAEPNITTPKTS